MVDESINEPRDHAEVRYAVGTSSHIYQPYVSLLMADLNIKLGLFG